MERDAQVNCTEITALKRFVCLAVALIAPFMVSVKYLSVKFTLSSSILQAHHSSLNHTVIRCSTEVHFVPKVKFSSKYIRSNTLLMLN